MIKHKSAAAPLKIKKYSGAHTTFKYLFWSKYDFKDFPQKWVSEVQADINSVHINTPSMCTKNGNLCTTCICYKKNHHVIAVRHSWNICLNILYVQWRETERQLIHLQMQEIMCKYCPIRFNQLVLSVLSTFETFNEYTTLHIF